MSISVINKWLIEIKLFFSFFSAFIDADHPNKSYLLALSGRLPSYLIYFPHLQQNWSRKLKATSACKPQQDLILVNYTYPNTDATISFN